MIVAANAVAAMFCSFRMELVSQRFGVCANGVICGRGVVIPDVTEEMARFLLSAL
jgi:hypothetical protein